MSVSHLEHEWSRQAFSVADTAHCSGQYSPGYTKTAYVFGWFTPWNRGLNMKGFFFGRKLSTSREISECVTPRAWMVKASLFGWIHGALQCSIFPRVHENFLCLWLIHSLEQRPKYERIFSLGEKKAPLERLRSASHLESEWSRQDLSLAHTASCGGQYSPGDTKTAYVFG